MQVSVQDIGDLNRNFNDPFTLTSWLTRNVSLMDNPSVCLLFLKVFSWNLETLNLY